MTPLRQLTRGRRYRSTVRSIAGLAAVALAAVVLQPFVSAAPPVQATTIGDVDFAGDSAVDSDSFSDSTSTQPRWLSYPGSRLVLNPNQWTDVKAPAGPMNNRLSLGAGGWFGTSALNFNDIVRTEIAATSGGSVSTPTSVSTTWFPYKIGFNSTYSSPASTSVSGYDFMPTAESIMRVINVDVPTTTPATYSQVVLSGSVPGDGGAQWQSGDGVLLVSDSDYYYAIRIVSLSGANLTPVSLLETASISGGEWSFRKAFSGDGNLAVSIGFASVAEDDAADLATARALSAFGSAVAPLTSATKQYWDALLRHVPAPSNWGVSGVATMGVTTAQHKAQYYRSWVFLLQDVMDELAENASTFPYAQVLAGKPSFWHSGHPVYPGTSQWESVFAYQLLSFAPPTSSGGHALDPLEVALDAYRGLLSQVGSTGLTILGSNRLDIQGEALPLRVAETAWVLYENYRVIDPTAATAFLESIADDLDALMTWAASEPHWICCGTNTENEKDIEFVASWLYDSKFALRIWTELGRSADVADYENQQNAFLDDFDNWFFTDSDLINGNAFMFTTSAPTWRFGNDSFKASALSVEGMDSAQRARLEEWFMSIHRPDEYLGNFHYHKHPDASLIVTGLLDNGGHVQAEEFTNASVRDLILAKHMAEVLIPTASSSTSGVDGVRTDSVAPSLFTATEMIQFTWLLNGVRIDGGTAEAFSFGSSSLDVTNSADVLPYIETFADVSEWDNPFNAFLSAESGAAVVRYEDVVGGSAGYGFVEKQVTLDLNTYPALSIDIGKVERNDNNVVAKWALKVNDGSGDIVLAGDTSDTGRKVFDLRGATGWSGTKTFTVKVFVIQGKVKVLDIRAMTAVDDFSSFSGWTPTGVTVSASSGIGTVTSTGAYGSVRKSFSYDVSAYPTLAIKVNDVGPGDSWSLKVNDGGADIVLQADTAYEGMAMFDLAGVTGWSGSKSFDIVLYAITPGGYVQVDYIAR